MCNASCTVLKPAVNGGACIIAPDVAAVVDTDAVTAPAPRVAAVCAVTASAAAVSAAALAAASSCGCE